MNRREHPTEIDHIDPRWKEGRDYQLICGLDCPLNYREEEWTRNTAKSNRFLPWRWCRDEIGVVPEEPGDLALFLVNDEWVLMEFLSDDWFEATKRTRGTTALHHRRDNASIVKKQWGTLREKPELIEARSQRMIQTFKDRGLDLGESIRRRYRCLVTGIESNVAGVVRAQRARGIDPTPENRIQIN